MRGAVAAGSVTPGSVMAGSVTAGSVGGAAVPLARNWWIVALRGVAGIALGLVAFAAPVALMVSLALVFAAYLFADGVLALLAAVRAAERHRRWGALAAEAVLSLAMAALILGFPGGAVLGFVLAVAGWALVSGVLLLAAAFERRHAPGRMWMALAGLVSIAWSVALLAAPLMGAVVLSWWLGAYALLFGLSLLALGLSLRRHVAPPAVV